MGIAGHSAEPAVARRIPSVNCRRSSRISVHSQTPIGISLFNHSYTYLYLVNITHCWYFGYMVVKSRPEETDRSCVFPLPGSAAWTR